jgi:hypothetical protein
MMQDIFNRLLEELQIRFKDFHMKIGAVVVGLILISLLFFVLRGEKHTYRTLFYPKVSYGQTLKNPQLLSEKRFLPLLNSQEEDIRLLVKELLLGPIRPEITGFCPKETRLISLFLKGNALYIDLSADLLEPAKVKVIVEPEYKLTILQKNISFNFHNVHKIHIFIEGQIPQFIH